jgi:hypothetical protein
MNTEVAVATIQGKAYFLIVKQLKESNIPFLSLIPSETVPAEIKVVITTEKEKHLVNHEKILLYNSETGPETAVNDIRKILEGKESYERIVVGIDPGEVFGLAVLADGKVSERKNCFSIHEALTKVTSVLEDVDFASTSVSIKIGNGVPSYKELMREFDLALPIEVEFEVVSESGTSHPLNHNKHRRGLRDIASAICIAGRAGNVYPRKKPEVTNKEQQVNF